MRVRVLSSYYISHSLFPLLVVSLCSFYSTSSTTTKPIFFFGFLFHANPVHNPPRLPPLLSTPSRPSLCSFPPTSYLNQRTPHFRLLTFHAHPTLARSFHSFPLLAHFHFHLSFSHPH